MMSQNTKNYEREAVVATASLEFGVHWHRTRPLVEAKSCREFLLNYCQGGERFEPRLSGPKNLPCFTPWLTPILGSGCAPDQVDPTILVKVLRGLGKAVESMGYVSSEMSGVHAIDFARDLARERLATERDFKEALQDGDVEDIASPAAKIIVLASLLTRLFHQLKIQAGAAPRRAGHDDSAYLDRHLTDWLLLESNYVDPSLRILKAISDKASLKEMTDKLTEKHLPSAGGRLQEFTSRIEERLKRRIVRTRNSLQTAGDLQLYWGEVQWWAELAWLMIAALAMRTEGTAAYPGWTDLLLELCCYGDVEEESYPSIVGRPIFANRFEGDDVIESKWRSGILDRLQGGTGPATRVHDAVARLLILQTSFRQQYPDEDKVQNLNLGKPGEPPVSSAFVTSFDLELEIALLRQLRGGEKILIAFPVYLSNRHNSVVHTCWLALEVERVDDLSREEDREKQLERLTRPRLECFSALSSVVLDDSNCPIIVRLAGCPLIKLPKIGLHKGEAAKATAGGNALSDQLISLFGGAFETEVASEEGTMDARKDAMEHILSTLQLHHAIIVSEHSATLHNVIDLLYSGAADGGQRPPNPGLPSDVAVSQGGWVRFWSLLGVQVGEGPIRQRVGTLLSVLPRNVGSSSRDVEVCGVAVNRRITALEADFLAWNGLVVIRSSVDDFLPIIQRQIKNVT